ncbi:unnamed protein product, partial [Closterium sp. NIES-54]
RRRTSSFLAEHIAPVRRDPQRMLRDGRRPCGNSRRCRRPAASRRHVVFRANGDDQRLPCRQHEPQLKGHLRRGWCAERRAARQHDPHMTRAPAVHSPTPFTPHSIYSLSPLVVSPPTVLVFPPLSLLFSLSLPHPACQSSSSPQPCPCSFNVYVSQGEVKPGFLAAAATVLAAAATTLAVAATALAAAATALAAAATALAVAATALAAAATAPAAAATAPAAAATALAVAATALAAATSALAAAATALAVAATALPAALRASRAPRALLPCCPVRPARPAALRATRALLSSAASATSPHPAPLSSPPSSYCACSSWGRGEGCGGGRCAGEATPTAPASSLSLLRVQQLRGWKQGGGEAGDSTAATPAMPPPLSPHCCCCCCAGGGLRG